MIIDYNLFTPGSEIRPNTLWIAEQIPGWVVSADESEVLSSTGYWASYNIVRLRCEFAYSSAILPICVQHLWILSTIRTTRKPILLFYVPKSSNFP